MRRLLLWTVSAALLFVAPALTLAETGTSGTTAGENIVSGGDSGSDGIANTAGDVVATFKINGGNTKTATCIVATVTVGQIYGGKWGTLPGDQTDWPAKTVNYEYQLSNLGNATDVFTLSIGSSGWNVDILKNGASIGSLTIAEDAMATFTVQVTIPDSANDNDTDTFVVTASTVNDGSAYIVGAWEYGGTDSLTDSGNTTCSSAMIALAKTYDVGTATGYNGSNANVPGSLVTYCIRYENTGSAVANDVTVTDMIPRHTTYVANSIKVGTDGETYAGAGTRTDTAVDTDGAQFNAGGVVQFDLGTVAKDTAGRLYYQVRID